MNAKEQINEQVSALMDGELDKSHQSLLIKRLSQDPELQRQWERFHLISDVLKNNTPFCIGKGFTEGISKAIEAEPEMDVVQTQAGHVSHLKKKVAGFAVAASVAVLGILGGQHVIFQEDLVSPQIAQTDTLNQPTVVAGGITQPTLVSLTGSSNHTGKQLTINDPYLNEYLINHHVHAEGASVHGLLPYARIVGYQK
jgi:sigma-E factor negative regulatory protein RseA